jgi:predicted DsbA family dithiol-disulfide isomerase
MDILSPFRSGTRPEVARGTIVIYTDVVCGWSTVALHGLARARAEAGLEDAVSLDLRLFPLEDINRFPIPKKYLDAELPVFGALEPDLAVVPWQEDPSTWPVTSLPANEAVHAAKLQSLRASEQLDMALRLAFFRDSRCIALRHEILDVASGCDALDVDALGEALDDGRIRGRMWADSRAHRDAVQGSPHLFFADGYDVHNPGIELHWQGDPGAGFPVVDSYEPEVFDELVQRAAATTRRS